MSRANQAHSSVQASSEGNDLLKMNPAPFNWMSQIATLLVEKDWSVRQLAREVGVSQTFMQDVVSGRKPASALLKIKVAQLSGLSKSDALLLDLLPREAADAWLAWTPM